MAIDRIGKGALPPAPETPGVQGAAPKAGVERPFHVERPASKEAASSAEAAAVQGSQPKGLLARLRAGEIDVNAYVDAKVDEATRDLPALSASERDAIRRILRDQLATDPALSDLVRAATGELPRPPED